jgi:hypothetical protein
VKTAVSAAASVTVGGAARDGATRIVDTVEEGVDLPSLSNSALERNLEQRFAFEDAPS